MDSNINKYLEQELMSASPAKLVFMLYEKAIGSLHEAIAAIDRGDVEGRWRANNRASEILAHMLATLNLDEGGKISDHLSQLFEFSLRRLLQVDFKNDPGAAREVIGLLEPLRDSWRDLASGQSAAPAEGQIAGDSPEQTPETPTPTNISA